MCVRVCDSICCLSRKLKADFQMNKRLLNANQEYNKQLEANRLEMELVLVEERSWIVSNSCNGEREDASLVVGFSLFLFWWGHCVCAMCWLGAFGAGQCEGLAGV